MYLRNCPNCNNEIAHTNKTARNNAVRWGRLCTDCGLIKRNPEKNPKIHPASCLKCGQERMYSSPETVVTSCKSCSAKDSHKADPDRLKGNKNPMFGKNPLEKLSPERMALLKKTRSKNAVGENNSMFGKPSPLKSGRGISGKYKGLHFRSLLELAFLEKFEKENKVLPGSAETQEYRINLKNGHTYCPDFTHDGTIFEIKPKRLLNTPENILKIKFGRDTFKDSYVVITEEDLPNYKGILKRLHEFSELILNRKA